MFEKKRSLVLPLLVALLILLIPFLIVPQVRLLFETSRDIEEGRGRLLRLEDKRSKLLATGELLRQHFLLASSALPSGKDVGIVLVALDALSQKHGVTLANFSTSALEEGGEQSKEGTTGVPAILVTVTVKGERTNITSLIEELEKSLPLMRIKAIAVVKDSAAISLASYYKPVQTALPPSDTPLVSLSDFNETIATLSSFTKQTSFQEASPGQEKIEFLPSSGGRENPFF